jgi:hypothetical protein
MAEPLYFWSMLGASTPWIVARLADAVYLLCALTSIACAAMLLRGYWRSRSRFLLWSCLCFVGLMANNMLLFIDNVVYRDIEWISPAWRSAAALIGLLLLLYGLIWDAE